MLLMVEKELETEYVMQYIGMQKQIIRLCKIMMKTKISSYIQYLGANKFYRWVVSQKLSGDGFKWKKMKTLRKTMMKIMIKDIFL